MVVWLEVGVVVTVKVGVVVTVDVTVVVVVGEVVTVVVVVGVVVGVVVRVDVGVVVPVLVSGGRVCWSPGEGGLVTGDQSLLTNHSSLVVAVATSLATIDYIHQ